VPWNRIAVLSSDGSLLEDLAYAFLSKVKCNILNIMMEDTPQKKYSMDFEGSESETFLPKPISSVINRRRNILDKFALLGWVLAIVLLAINAWRWINPRQPTDLECTKKLTAWSPVFDAVEYEDVQFSNTFFQPSPYKGKPTPELEKAWSDLWKSKTAGFPWPKDFTDEE